MLWIPPSMRRRKVCRGFRVKGVKGYLGLRALKGVSGLYQGVGLRLSSGGWVRGLGLGFRV